MTVRLLVLGPLEIRGDGRSVPIAGRRQQTLLAVLLLDAGRPVALDRLVDEVWDDPPASVRQQIHNAVGSLRRVLGRLDGGPRLVRAGGGYRLDLDGAALDAHEFAAATTRARALEADDPAGALALLRDGLGLWRGDALAGLDGPTIRNAAAGLREQRLAAVEHAMTLRLATGEATALVADLRRLVGEHPLREPVRGLLMLALARSGRRADALAVYDEGRRALAEQLGVDPGPGLRAVHAEVLRDEPAAGLPIRTARAAGSPTAPPLTAPPAAPPAAVVAAAAPVAAPPEVATAEPCEIAFTERSSLPHDTHEFAGRETELAELRSATGHEHSTALVISAIDGMGGIGKTTLAVRLAHQLAGDYPDGQFFVDLHGFTAGVEPRSPRQVLDQLLRDTGVPPELIPPDLDGRSSMWRSRIARRRALLLFDNAVDAAHVRPLLPGTAGPLVIVTSRRKLAALEGAVPVSLDVLPRADAIALFTTVAGERRVAAEPDQVATAVELCGGLPLAIRIAAARLRDRAGWTVADLVARLGDQARRMRFLRAGDRNVMAALRLSYRYLPAEQQRMFRLLGLHPGTDFDAHAAAAIAGCAPDAAEQQLESLFDDNLLKQHSAGRYFFHDLVRDCARELLAETVGEDEQEAAVDRLLDHYVGIAETWTTDLGGGAAGATAPATVPPLDSRESRMAALHTEHANLAAAARLAAERGRPGHAWRIPVALQPFLRSINYGGGSYELVRVGLDAARADGAVRGEASCLRVLAAVCRDRRTRAEAVEHLHAALRLATSIGDVESEAGMLVDLGNLHLDEERLDAAADTFRRAMPMTIGHPRPLLHVLTLNNLGVVSRDLGRFDEALAHIGEALVRLHPDDAPRWEPVLRWSMGMVEHLRGRDDVALDAFDAAVELSRATGDRYGESLGQLGRCAARRVLGDLAGSVRAGRRALVLARELEARKVECETLANLAETAYLQGDLDRATAIGRQTLTRARSQAATRYEARALEGLAHVSAARGDVVEADTSWRAALALYAPGMVDARHPTRHLGTPGATCFRCRRARPVSGAAAAAGRTRRGA